MAHRIGQQLGKYRLVRLIGQGSFAEVYLGEHVLLGTQAAVKVLQTRLTAPGEFEHFQQEASIIAHLEHPHIVRVLDFDVQEDTPFLIMAYAPGGTLRQRHSRGVPLPLSTIVDYLEQVAEGLQYAHEHKVIHRDIKPENLLIGPNQEILLSDFGVALLAQSSRFQSTQEVAGSPLYMAPEQLQGKPRLASDQYALGIVVYEWLCGRCPFEGSFSEIASQHLLTPPLPLAQKIPSISPELDQVVLTALEKDPYRRFGSVRAFANAFEQACRITPHMPPAYRDPSAGSASDAPSPTPSDVHGPSASSTIPAGISTPPGSGVPRMPLARPSLARRSLSNPQPLPAGPPQIKQPRRLSTRLLVALLAVIFLVIAGSGLFTYIAVLRQNQHHTQGSATAATANPYFPYSGTLALSDPLHDNSRGYKWDDSSINCFFADGSYNVNAPNPNFNNDCLAHVSNFGDFTFEVQMQIIQGDGGGGIDFRQTATATGNYYHFEVNQDGTYFLWRMNGSTPTQLKNDNSAAIKQGLNQSNLLAVTAQGSIITLYVNHQQIASVTDSSFSSGQIGFQADPNNAHPTEVAFHYARVWKL